jgi:hypothetical protein
MRFNIFACIWTFRLDKVHTNVQNLSSKIIIFVQRKSVLNLKWINILNHFFFFFLSIISTYWQFFSITALYTDFLIFQKVCLTPNVFFWQRHLDQQLFNFIMNLWLWKKPICFFVRTLISLSPRIRPTNVFWKTN